MALGSGSITVAITSMASSFGLPESAFCLSACGLFDMRSCVVKNQKTNSPAESPNGAGGVARTRQNPRTVFRDRDGMLEMRGVTAIRGDRGPLVLEHLHRRTARIHHRLDGQHHSRLQFRTVPRLAVIRQLQILVHFSA